MRYISDPRAIQELSFSLIEPMLAGLPLSPGEKAVVKRVVHTTGDPECARLMYFHPEAIAAGLAAIEAGGNIFTDVKMVQAGIAAGSLARFGGRVDCLIDDEEVAMLAPRRGTTRSAMAMHKRAATTGFAGEIVAVGNAPTALFALAELIEEGRARPALVVGTAVGFVGAKESKELIERSGVPCITIRGTRGGSAIAAAVVNALLSLLP